MKTILLSVLTGLLSMGMFAQNEVEDNDHYGEATVVSTYTNYIGTTDTDWQGDLWRLELTPGTYPLEWTGDGCTRVRIIEYVQDPVLAYPTGTPGAISTCPATGDFECHVIDNLDDGLSANLSETFTVVQGRFYFLFINPHNCTGENYTVLGGQTVGIDEESNPNLSIYPNPANEQFTIEGYAGTWELHSTSGQLLLSGNKNKVDISSLTQGVYLLTLENGEVHRLIKN